MDSVGSVNTADVPQVRPGKLNFILVCVFIDMLGIGLAIPVLPTLVGEFVGTRELQAHWYGILATVFRPAAVHLHAGVGCD